MEGQVLEVVEVIISNLEEVTSSILTWLQLMKFLKTFSEVEIHSQISLMMMMMFLEQVLAAVDSDSFLVLLVEWQEWRSSPAHNEFQGGGPKGAWADE